MHLTKLTELIIKEVSAVGDEYGSGPASGLEGWMVTKSRGGSAIADADQLRKALRNDDTFVRVMKALVTPGEEVFVGTEGIHILKARHAVRHETSGQFVPAPAAEAPQVFPFEASGAVHPVIARAAAMASGKKPPADSGRSDHLGIYGDPSPPNPGS